MAKSKLPSGMDRIAQGFINKARNGLKHTSPRDQSKVLAQEQYK